MLWSNSNGKWNDQCIVANVVTHLQGWKPSEYSQYKNSVQSACISFIFESESDYLQTVLS